MRHGTRILALILLLALICGCSKQPTDTPPPAPTDTTTPRPMVSPTSQPAPTATLSATKPPPPTEAAPSAVVSQDGKVTLGDSVILDIAIEAPECLRVGEISYSPSGEHFLVILACPDWQDVAFLFRADGGEKRAINGAWDYVRFFNYQWSADGRSLLYDRINSCCEPSPDIPLDAPLPGMVRYDVQTGEKTLVSKFRVVNVQSGDRLNVRSDPGVTSPIVGEIPPDGRDIQITGAGMVIGNSRWVPVKFDDLEGWVNLGFLEQQPGL